MRKKIILGVGVVLGVGAALAWARTQGAGGSLAPEVWRHEGDTDGDGLKDAFEVAHGLDPQKVESYPDGIPDESRLAADGRTMWEVQEAGVPAPPTGGDGGGGGCGATGMETMGALGLVGILCLGRRIQKSRKRGANTGLKPCGIAAPSP